MYGHAWAGEYVNDREFSILYYRTNPIFYERNVYKVSHQDEYWNG